MSAVREVQERLDGPELRGRPQLHRTREPLGGIGCNLRFDGGLTTTASVAFARV